MADLIDKPQYIIVGAGLTGSVIANKIATELNSKVLILEKRNHIAGNCYDYIDKDTGLLISKYGPHIFHTDDRKIWNYINSFIKFTFYQHKELSSYNDKTFHTPINVKSINTICNANINNITSLNNWIENNSIKYDEITNGEELAKNRFGEEIYEKIIKPYVFKKWGKYPDQIDKDEIDKIILRKNQNDVFYKERYQGIPKFGYTDLINKMITHKNIKYHLNTDFFEFKEKFNIDGIKIIYTGPIDTYFSNSNYEKLEYRYLNISIKKHLYYEKKYYQDNSIINYPSCDISFTRTIEYKHFLNQKSPHTIIATETFDSSGSDCILPVPDKQNLDLHLKYKKLANDEKDVYFIGMLANYKYFSMSDTIKNALNLYDKSIKPNHKNIKIEPKISNVIVISRYKEDINWVKFIAKNKLIDKIVIYNKGDFLNFKCPKVIIKDSLNIGKHNGSLLDYIIFNFDNIPENIWFLNGNPFIQNPDIIHLLSDNIIPKYINNLFQHLTVRMNENKPKKEIYSNNNLFSFDDKSNVLRYFIDKNTLQTVGSCSFQEDNIDNDILLPFKEKYIDTCGNNTNQNPINFICNYINIIPPENNIIEYFLGNCFFIKSSQIKKYNIKVFERLRTLLYESNPNGGFQTLLIEKFWGFLFSNKSYSDINKTYKRFISDKQVIASFNRFTKKMSIASNRNNIIENKNSIIFFKKENKLCKIEGLEFESSKTFTCNSFNLAIKNYEYKIWNTPLIIFLSGDIKNSFSNNLLRKFLTQVIRIDKNIKIYIHTWHCENLFYSINRNSNDNTINKDKIKKYLGDEISKKIEYLIVDNYKNTNFIGNRNGNVGNEQKIITKIKIEGKYKIFDILNKEKKPYVINLNFDLFNNMNSWKNKINVKTAFDFVYSRYLNKNDNCFFLCNNKNYCDAIYYGEIKKLFNIYSNLHTKLDDVLKLFNNNANLSIIFYLLCNEEKKKIEKKVKLKKNFEDLPENKIKINGTQITNTRLKRTLPKIRIYNN